MTIVREICRLISPIIVEGCFDDFWDFKKKIAENTSNSIKTKFLIHIYFRYIEKKSCWIGLNSEIQGKATTPHGLYGIFISNKAKIGKNAVIFQHVTIGSNNLRGSKRQGSPIIGDNVYIGAGAKIIGKISIGNNVRIGANCIVVQDVPDNCVVVTKGTSIIQKDTILDNTYIENS